MQKQGNKGLLERMVKASTTQNIVAMPARIGIPENAMSTEIGADEVPMYWREMMHEVRNGERYVITQHGKPIADLIPFQPEARQERSKAAARQLLALLVARKPFGLNIKAAIDDGRT